LPNVVQSISDLDTICFALEESPASTYILDVGSAGLHVLLEVSARRATLARQGIELKVTGQSDFLDLLRESEDGICAVDASCGVLRFRGDNGPTFTDVVAEFLVRASGPFDRAGIPVVARRRLLGSLGELIDNVPEHSGHASKALAGFWVNGSTLQMGVADNGQGILAAYHQQPGWDLITDAGDALKLAVVDNRSRYGVPERGLGFRNLVAALRSVDARLRVSSDDACLETDPLGRSAHQFIIREKPALAGFVVSVEIPLSLG
jgi:hypothetical protein